VANAPPVTINGNGDSGHEVIALEARLHHIEWGRGEDEPSTVRLKTFRMLRGLGVRG